MMTGPILWRTNSSIGKPCSEKNIIRTSADLSKKAVFLMWELKSISPQPAISRFSNTRRPLSDARQPFVSSHRRYVVWLKTEGTRAAILGSRDQTRQPHVIQI